MEDEVIDEVIDESVEQEENMNVINETEIEPVIYTGPNVLAMNLQRFRVFRGGLSPEVKRAIEKIPEIESLIVPVSELEDMRQKIDKSGTNEARLFAVIKKEAEKISAEYVKSHRKRGRR